MFLAVAGASGCTESIPVWQLDPDASTNVDADVALDTAVGTGFDTTTMPFDTFGEDTFIPTVIADSSVSMTGLADTSSTTDVDTTMTTEDTWPPTTSVTDSSLGTSPLGDTSGSSGDSVGGADITR